MKGSSLQWWLTESCRSVIGQRSVYGFCSRHLLKCPLVPTAAVRHRRPERQNVPRAGILDPVRGSSRHRRRSTAKVPVPLYADEYDRWLNGSFDDANELQGRCFPDELIEMDHTADLRVKRKPSAPPRWARLFFDARGETSRRGAGSRAHA